MANKRKPNPAEEALREGIARAHSHPMLAAFLEYTRCYLGEDSQCPDHLLAIVSSRGEIHFHPRRRLSAAQWAWVTAHCFLHLGLDHHREHAQMDCWNQACDEVVARMLAGLRVGEAPPDYPAACEDGPRDEEGRYQQLVAQGSPGRAPRDLLLDGVADPPFSQVLAHGLRQAVEAAVAAAAGVDVSDKARRLTPFGQARDWFLASYPLLGALASAFEIVEDAEVCRALGIQVAAVSETEGKIYMNPRVPLLPDEIRFVMAHEFLHAGLSHGSRCGDRHPFVWNLACDYVINAWLIEMGVGQPPRLGLLHDPQYQGMAAEEVYERLCCDIRACARQGTFRGIGQGDILTSSGRRDEWRELDEYYRRCLCQGFDLHQRSGRGLISAGLAQEIRALQHPPIPWDVELARWLDHFFPPLDRLRSYARPSRRQQACPDIPRPSRSSPGLPVVARTFGVVLDTSGSMDRQILGKALGAIAAYAQTRDVPMVRLVCCDAQAFDLGYLPAEEIGGRVRLRGRGGTVLQPGVDLIDAAQDFPEKGPLLIITDACCDRVQVPGGRKHAYLIPGGATLPMPPRGPVFRIALT